MIFKRLMNRASAAQWLANHGCVNTVVTFWQTLQISSKEHTNYSHLSKGYFYKIEVKRLASIEIQTKIEHWLGSVSCSSCLPTPSGDPADFSLRGLSSYPLLSISCSIIKTVTRFLKSSTNEIPAILSHVKFLTCSMLTEV